VLAQGIPTGTLNGHVTGADGGALPGVLVTAESPSLQGSRSATTNSNGDFNIPLLPPGEYEVSFELEGFQAVKRTVKVSAAQEATIDTDLQLAGVSEEIVVTGTYETISTTPQVSTTFEKKFVASLPVERNVRETVLLTPGVSDTGPGGTARTRGLSISGSQSYENLYLVNGVVVNENIRGQDLPLFIEDAIEETTTSTAGISAEYGRFAGGVINVLTKSGGNELSGSFRTVLTNDSWSSKTPITVDQTDKVNKRYEATLGGFVMRDRLWYFLAGRNFKNSIARQTVAPNTSSSPIPYDDLTDEKRYEGKLTAALAEGHRIVGSYIKIDQTEDGNSFGSIMDTASLVNRATPQELYAANYSGVLSSNFFVEGQYSQRKFTFQNSGSRFTDLIQGTLLVDSVTGNRWNSPTFCGVCRDEGRDNKNWLAKASWFLSTGSLGSHDISAGYDTFSDIRTADNHQSGSDFRIIITSTLARDGVLFPRLVSGNTSTFIQWNPILVSSEGTDFKTDSLFLNDKWRLNDHFSFNLGVRYDKNDGKNSEGTSTAKDSRISPRLAMGWDPKGDGDWVVNASYANYVTALANSQGDATSRGGNPASITWFYRGPSINADPNAATLVPTDAALQQLWDWFASQGGTDNTSNLRSLNIPGGTSVIRGGSLDSPYTEELSAGISKRLGSHGLFRVDFVHRESKDFYSQQRDLTTGQVITPAGTHADLTVLGNSNDGLSRKYDGVLTQAQYRFNDRLSVGGFYTWSHLRGNVDGETSGSGPVSATVHVYPEYQDPSWSSPQGDLAADQRHRLRIYALYDIFKTSHHNLQVGLLQNYYSGVPYGAARTIDTRPFVTNPGYAIPPSSVTYFFTARDAFRTDNITATDLSINYGLHFDSWGKGVEIYVQPQILNIFNEHGVIGVNTSVLSGASFNPFTTTPVEGVNWSKGEFFGKPVRDEDYQVPRTFRLSLGFRF
jgi:outer membrane receptor protein involved in Fe transport